MLKEYKNVAQSTKNKDKRRWFNDDKMDLTVWYIEENIKGFQLIYETEVFLLIQLFPEQVIRTFIGQGSSAMETTVHGIRIYMAMLPIVCINIFGVGYFQAIKEGRKAFILGILRQIVLLIPILTVLPRMFGLTGVWASVPLADGIAVAISLMFIVPALRSIKEDEEELETVETTI